MDGVENIRSVPALRAAITNAKTRKDRELIYLRAAYLGLLSKIPSTWRPDGTIIELPSEE